jgi:hypothetical protein
MDAFHTLQSLMSVMLINKYIVYTNEWLVANATCKEQVVLKGHTFLAFSRGARWGRKRITLHTCPFDNKCRVRKMA